MDSSLRVKNFLNALFHASRCYNERIKCLGKAGYLRYLVGDDESMAACRKILNFQNIAGKKRFLPKAFFLTSHQREVQTDLVVTMGNQVGREGRMSYKQLMQ